MSRRYKGFICRNCNNSNIKHGKNAMFLGVLDAMCEHNQLVEFDKSNRLKCPMRRQKNPRATKIKRVRHKQLEKARKMGIDKICAYCTHVSIGFTYCTVDLSKVKETDLCKNGKFSNREY